MRSARSQEYASDFTSSWAVVILAASASDQAASWVATDLVAFASLAATDLVASASLAAVLAASSSAVGQATSPSTAGILTASSAFDLSAAGLAAFAPSEPSEPFARLGLVVLPVFWPSSFPSFSPESCRTSPELLQHPTW